LLGWVFNEQWAEKNPAALMNFLQASYAAKRLLATSDSEWERIMPLTNVADTASLHAMRDAYRAGIPQRFSSEDREAAAAVFAILAKEGGEELAGRSTALNKGTFWTRTSPQALTP